MTEGDVDAVARQADDSFDEALMRVPRVAENHNVSTIDGLKPVHQLVDDDAFLVFKAGLHAAALHLHRLIDKQNNEECNQYGKEQVAHPGAQRAQTDRFRGRLGRFRLDRFRLLLRHLHSAQLPVSIIRRLAAPPSLHFRYFYSGVK